MPLAWTDKFSTSVKEIDEHHQTIIQQLNHLQEQMAQGKGKEEIGKTIVFLEAYAKMHFEQEEKIMEKYNCAAAELNKQQHAVFLEKMASFKERYENPVLVSSIDGVGTKLKVASLMNKFDTVGIDIVSHCCNDIVVQGAEPLFFMDYIGGSMIKPDDFSQILKEQYIDDIPEDDVTMH